MSDQRILKPTHPVGIIGYGAYVPRYRLPATEVARVWTDGEGGLPIKEKAVAGIDEDVATMSIEAARNALLRRRVSPTKRSRARSKKPMPVHRRPKSVVNTVSSCSYRSRKFPQG